MGSDAILNNASLRDSIEKTRSILRSKKSSPLTVTTTGIRDLDKDQVKMAVAMLGGRFADILKQRETAYLIEQHTPKKPSSKHTTAIQLKIPIVHPDWLFHCL